MSDASPRAQEPSAPAPAAARASCTVVQWPVFTCEHDLENDRGDGRERDSDTRQISHVSDDAVAFAEQHGFVVVRDVVPQPAIARLAETVQRSAQALGVLTAGGAMASEGDGRGGWHVSPFDDPRWVQLQQQVLPSPAFLAVGDSPPLLALIARLGGGSARTRRGDICRILAPQQPQQTMRPHQDHWYLGGPPVVWTAWLPLAPCAMDDGGLAVLPGSHRLGLRPHTGAGNGRQGCAVAVDAQWASGDLQPGDAVLFHCMTVHRTWHNLSETRPRLSVDFRYQPRDAPLHTTRVDGTRAGT